MNYYTFRTIIEPDENNTYHGFVPVLKGCHTFGDSVEETKKNLEEAIKCHLEGLLKDGERIPQESECFESVQTIAVKELVFA